MRSYLFAPAADDRLVPKALASEADVVVLDLEDAMLPALRGRAEETLLRHTEAIADRPTDVRVGVDDDGSYRADDVELAVRIGARSVRLPKVESPDAVATVAEQLERLGGAQPLHLTVESARGLAGVTDFAAASSRVTHVVFGERDFLADLGVDAPGTITDHARAALAVAARTAGLAAPIDGAFVDLEDGAGLRHAAQSAKALGFWGKSAIHPAQVAVIHDVFRHSDAQVEWAQAVIAAHRDAGTEGRAVAVVDGSFVDAAIVRRAMRILEEVEA